MCGHGTWWAGHNANVKAIYTRVMPFGRAAQNEVTLQLQVFVF